MLHIDFSTLNLPVHIGDTLYYVDTAAGYTVHKCEDFVTGIVLQGDDELWVLTEDDEESPQEIGSDYFLTREEAVAWANENRPSRPYPYGRDAEQWMPVDTWMPISSNRVYVKIRKGANIFICPAYYFDGRPDGLHDTPEDEDGKPAAPGFFDSRDKHAEKLTGVIAWIDHALSLNEALEAGEYETPEGL